MKNHNLLGLALTAFFSLSHSVIASEKYPASDFQPSVIYLDKSLVTETATEETTFDPKYPAANFQPVVIYSDNSLVGQSQSAPAAKAEEKDEFDAKYPAAYFKPKVIYP